MVIRLSLPHIGQSKNNQIVGWFIERCLTIASMKDVWQSTTTVYTTFMFIVWVLYIQIYTQKQYYSGKTYVI